MLTRLIEVLETVTESKNCSRNVKELLKGVIELSDELYSMDYNDFEDLLNNDADFIDLIEATLGIDVSDLFD